MKSSLSFRHRPLLAILVCLAAIHIGCGHTTKVQNENETSVGQQLVDLEKAHSEGIISDKEYKKLKKALVKKNE